MVLLKVGSRGPEVKLLQERLNIGVDGIFGSGTEAAVLSYQSSNNLSVDGIVGPLTWEHMQLSQHASTDLQEIITPLTDEFNIEQYFLPKGEYLEGPTKKEYLFLHHTAGRENPYKQVDQWGRDRRGRIGTEYVIGGTSIKGESKYDGKILQCIPQGGYGWHLGKNGSQHMHTHSTSVELCNFSYLQNGKTWVDEKVSKDQIHTLNTPFRGYTQFHKYSDTQLNATKELIYYIADRDNIDVRKGLVEEVKNKGAKGFEFNSDAYYGNVKGMWTHTNTRKDKFDLFPQPELIDMLLSI